MPFFEVKNQNEPISIKVHTTQDFINEGKSLISNKGKIGWKSNINVDFSKQMLPFHLFVPFILKYVIKCAQCFECYCYYIPYMFSVFINIIFECYNLLVDLVS